MKRPSSAWADALMAGVLAVLTGREVLKDLRGRAEGRGECATKLGDHAAPDQGTAASASGGWRNGVGRPPEREPGQAGQQGPHGAVERQPLPPGVHLPRPSVWPMVLGAGLSLLLFGVVTSYAFVAIGVLVIVAALGGWVGDLLHAGAD